jgi:hypothetical protein
MRPEGLCKQKNPMTSSGIDTANIITSAPITTTKTITASNATCISQHYWVLGLCPSSGILETGKHKVSETGSFSVLR